MNERAFSLDTRVGTPQSRFDGLMATGIDRVGEASRQQAWPLGFIGLYSMHEAAAIPDGISFGYVAEFRELTSSLASEDTFITHRVGRLDPTQPESVVYERGLAVQLKKEPNVGEFVDGIVRPEIVEYDHVHEAWLFTMIGRVPQRRDWFDADLGVQEALGVPHDKVTRPSVQELRAFGARRLATAC